MRVSMCEDQSRERHSKGKGGYKPRPFPYLRMGNGMEFGMCFDMGFERGLHKVLELFWNFVKGRGITLLSYVHKKIPA